MECPGPYQATQGCQEDPAQFGFSMPAWVGRLLYRKAEAGISSWSLASSDGGFEDDVPQVQMPPDS